jgi:hypothetical protein
MPNWVTTKITLTGADKDIEDVLAMVNGGENQEFDFEKLIPMPDNIYQGNLGMEEREKYGINNWYDWSIYNWGTKWNACHCDVGGNEIFFDTAWSVCEPVLAKFAELCHNHNLTFNGCFLDEDYGGGNAGFFECGYQGEFNIWWIEDTDVHNGELKDIILELWGEDTLNQIYEWEREYEEERGQ